MRSKSAVFLTFVFLFLVLPVSRLRVHSSTPYINLEGCSWDHPTLNVLLIPNSSSWFDPSYLTYARLAIDSWKASINAYTNAYGSSYLNKIEFKVFVYGINSTLKYDIYIRFYKDLGDGIAGVTRYYYYEESGKLINATITIASEVYGVRLSYIQIRNTVAHEIGHALGLGHASEYETINGYELMYYAFDFQQTIDRIVYPSTLDIYALSKIYAWLQSGIYEGPILTSVSLPSSIPYKEAIYFKLTIVNAYGSNLSSGWYLFGSVVHISINEIYTINSSFRYRFLKWIGRGSNSYTGSSTSYYIKITGDVYEEATWIPQYFVNVTSNPIGISYGSGWYDNNSIATISTVSKFKNSSLTRYIFYSWNGSYRIEKQNFSIYVTKPLYFIAIWKCYYYVNINFDKYVNFRSGWYENGTSLDLRAEDVVGINENERIVFVNWNFSSFTKTFKLNVIRPVNLTPVYYVQYFVKIDEGEGKTLNSSTWVFSGKSIKVIAYKIVNISNSERLVFVKWVGSYNSSSCELKILVDGPKILKALWKTQFYVNVSSPIGEATGSGWYDKDAYANISIKPTTMGFLIREVFDKWTGSVSSSNSTLIIKVDGPKNLVAVWRKDYSRLILMILIFTIVLLLYLVIKIRSKI